MAGTVLVGTLLNEVSTLLNDVAGARWGQVVGIGGGAPLTSWANLGMVELAKVTRDAYVIRQTFKLNARSTLQSGVVPASTIKILSLTTNMGQDGVTRGKAIREIPSLDVMDRSYKDWHTIDPDIVITDWVRQEEDFQSFFVAPRPANASCNVEILHVPVPPAVAALTDTFPTADKYQAQLVLYITGMALMQNIPEGDVPRGVAYLNTFYTSLGQKPPQGIAA